MSLVQMSFSGAVMIIAILLVRAIGINKLPKKVFVVLWEVAFFRLLIPISIPSVFSAYSMMRENHVTQGIFTEGAVSYLIPQAQEVQFAVSALIPETQEVQSAAAALIPETQEVQLAATALIPEMQEIPSAATALIPETQEVQLAATALIPEMQEIPSAVSANLTEMARHEIPAVLAEASLPLGMTLWIAGMAICFLFFFLSYLRCYREFKMSLPVRNAFAEEWLEGHRIKRGIRIRQSDRISSPLTYGIFRPVILMPKTTDWEDIQRLQYVLQHEYIHIRRFDMIRKFAAALVLCIHWFNPAVWMMYVMYNRDIELSCDESVIRKFGESSKSVYAEALIAMEEKRNNLQPLTNSFSKNAIEERIRAVMKTKKVTVWAVIISIMVVAVIIVVFATSANSVENDTQDNTDAVNGEDALLSADMADTVNNDGQADADSRTGGESGISSDSAGYEASDASNEESGEATGKEIITFYDMTITEDMLKECHEYSYSVESYENDPILLLDPAGLYGIRSNGQQAMLYYRDGETILIEHPFQNMYYGAPELEYHDLDRDGKSDWVISVIEGTGSNIYKEGMIVCDQKDTWYVYEYDDYLKDIEELIKWQYDKQENSILFMNYEGVILTEIKLPEWTDEYPFAGNVVFSEHVEFDAVLMQLRVEPYILLESSLPYRPIEIVFHVDYKNGDFSLGSYTIQNDKNGTSAQDPGILENPIGTDYTGQLEGFNLSEYVERYVTLTDDTEIEKWEMLNHNGENILRIRVGYNQEDLRGTIQGHKEDYFLFLDGNGNVGYVLQVGYEDKNIGMACNYEAHFEDVTFDGNDDLVIWLGAAKNTWYCAFIYENGRYRYEKSFEDIYSYRVDVENQVIRGLITNSATSHSYCTYEYQNGKFVEVENRTIELEYRDGEYYSTEYLNGEQISTEKVEYPE